MAITFEKKHNFMKKLLTLSAIALMGMAVISGCSKSSSSSPSYTMTATIAGKSFNGTNCIASVAGGQLVVDGGAFTTATATYPYIALSVANYTGTVTYSFCGTTLNVAGIDSSASSLPVSQYGTITVTAASSTVISGTFSFTCSDSTKVTGGTFSAKVD